MLRKTISLLLIFSFFIFSSGAQDLAGRKKEWNLLKSRIKKEVNSFPGQACFVIKDLGTGWEISMNKNTRVPAASVIKIPIMAACFEAVEKGDMKLNQCVTLRSRHKVEGSGKLKYACAGTKVSINRLMDLMITESDNTATNMLIQLFGFPYLNRYFKKIGLFNTSISRLMMDMKARKRGVENYTTAKDMAIAIERMYKGQLVNKDVSEQCMGLLKKQKLRDRIPKKLPPNILVAHKTGLEKRVCHDVGIVYTPKGNFLVSALTKHRNKTSRASKNFIANISLLTYNYYQKI